MKNTILVIDDDEIFNYVVKDHLHHIKTIKWFNIETNGKDAIDFLSYKESKSDFPMTILLDLNMPDLSGLDFLDIYHKLYSKKHPETKIIIVTSSSDLRLREQAMQFSFVKGFILKPVTGEDITSFLI